MYTFEIPYTVGTPEVRLKANGMVVEIVNFFPGDVLIHKGAPHHHITSWIFPQLVVGQGCFGTSDTPQLSAIGNLTFVPADTPTVSHFLPEDRARRAIVFRFASDLLDSLIEDQSLHFDPRSMASLNFHDPYIQGALRLLAEEAKAPGLASTTLTESIGKTVLVQLLRHFQQREQEKRGGLLSWQMRRVTERIADQSADLPTVDKLAALVGMSAGHLRRSFKERTGCAIGDHLRSARFERACGLLTGTCLPLKVIAARLGFSSQYGFTVAFQHIAGETPRAFRMRMRPHR